MKIRFLADYDFNAEIIDGLLRREPTVDLKSGHEAGLEAVPDPDVLERQSRLKVEKVAFVSLGQDT